jgi:HDOD domain
MLNQAIDTVTDHSWIPSSVWRRLVFSEQKKFARKKVDLLDDVPVMSATVLGLEILLHEPCIDLGMASELILSDVGATIQILRLVGREYEFAAEHPNRMGDCLASLDSSTWFEAISARTFPCDREHSAITSLWNHCRLVAQYAQLVAESLENISPEEAYLVGLLHEIRTIPYVLGRPNGSLGGRESAALSAMEGSLPLFVLAAIRSMNASSSSSTWRFILTAAHELADARGVFDASPLSDFTSVAVTTCS